MKTVGAFNADFVQVILLVNTRYSLLMDLALAELKRHFVRYIASFFLLQNLNTTEFKSRPDANKFWKLKIENKYVLY